MSIQKAYNVIVALKEFLIYYQQEFGYHLEDVTDFISDKELPINESKS